ncbi:trypsin-like serine protease [Pyxidicoccus parkwayensis]|uniref:Trypsin-like serine protease n=1 Tax=Pyxidicoccus parkwayensis TaxID=2813578 RepID=A0ABX7NR72_9BACT|nr:trypsin-like serine protease [Pyxidicoccus parkwaysis]QSQ21371.1 trypsin-like serine protease [Pyxidicoccus parkwaysis]
MRIAVGLMLALERLRAQASALALVATAALPGAAQATPTESARVGTVWVKVLVDVSFSMSTVTRDGRTRFEALEQEFQTLSRSFNETDSKSCPIKLELEAFRSYPEQLNADSVAACLPPASRTTKGTSSFFTKRQALKPIPPSGFPAGLRPEGPLTDTPLSTAFQVAADELAHLGRPSDAHILLLITDGVPSCRRRSPDCTSGWCEFAQEQLRDEFREQWTAGAGHQVCSATVSAQHLGALEHSVFPLPGLSPACTQYAGPSLQQAGDGSTDKEQLTLLLKGAACHACGQCADEVREPIRPPIPPCPPEPAFSEVVAVGVSGRSRCTGVLLTPSTVLTARHCVPATEVLAGESITRPEARRTIIRTVLPPDARLDAALLWLDRPIDTAIRPWKSEAAPIAQASGVHVGFGTLSPSGELGFGDKHVTLLSLVDAGCTAQQALHSGCNPAFEWALRGSPGYDTCSGDSGGGLYESIYDGRQCRDAHGRVQLVHDWRLRGITSRSLAGSMSACGAGGIYTRMDVLTPWLEQVLAQPNL